MTSYADFIAKAVCQAAMPGDSAEPTALLMMLAGVEKPVEALCNFNKANDFFASFYQEFEFLQRATTQGASLPPEEQARCASLLRWLIQALRRWRRAQDPQCVNLAALIVVAQACDAENQLCKLLPNDIGGNSELIQALKRLVSSFAVEFTSRDSARTLIWEQEAVDEFKLADAAGDWAKIGERWKPFDELVWPNSLQKQSVRCLNRYNLTNLVEALANIRQTGAAMLIAATLTVEQRLQLAAASANPHVQFACVYRVLSEHPHVPQLPDAEALLLTKVLLQVAAEESRWLGWMQVFNAYPLRYPALQHSLGQALATVPEPAVRAYVDSIVLHVLPASPDPNRRNIATCLQAFRAAATPERRCALWTLAHDRWSAWRFDQANPETHLFAVNWSQLDYAVVAYTSECLDQAERDANMNTVREKLGELDDLWHNSITDIVTAWNRLLSQFQPYAHSLQILKSGEDWLTESRTYLPFDPAKDTYLAMKYQAL